MKTKQSLLDSLNTWAGQLRLALAVVAVICLTLLVSHIILGDAFNREESQHALNGLQIYKDLKVLDFGAFWFDTQRQMVWPFLHSWVLAVFFMLFGPSSISARLASWLIMVATLALMYHLSTHLHDKHGEKIGILSIFLALSSPLIVTYSTRCALEGLGALIFVAGLVFYIQYEERKATLDYIFLGVLIGVSLYVNYLYAYFIIQAFLVMTLGKLAPITKEVMDLGRKGEKAAYLFFWWFYRKLVFLSVVFFFFTVWFGTSNFARKLALCLQAIFNYSGGETITNFWQNIFYYPAAIVKEFSFSPWLGGLILVSLFLPFLALNKRVYGKLYIFIWTILILATFTIFTKAPQIIYIVAPFIFIVFSAAIVHGLEAFKKYAKVIVLLVFLPAIFSVDRLGMLYFPTYPMRDMIKVQDYFFRSVPNQAPVAAGINLRHLSPDSLAFRFGAWQAPVYFVANSFDDGLLNSADYFLKVEIPAGSPAQSEIVDDSTFQWDNFLREKEKTGQIKGFLQKNFDQLGLTAKIYEKIR